MTKAVFYRNTFDRRGVSVIDDIKLITRYRRIIKTNRPSIVLTYTIKPNGCMVCGLLDVPYIANITGLGSAIENENALQRIALVLYKLGLKNQNVSSSRMKRIGEFMLKKVL